MGVLNYLKIIKNYCRNYFLHFYYNICNKLKKYSDDRVVLDQIFNMPEIVNVNEVLTVGVAHYTYKWRDVLWKASIYDSIDIDKTKNIFALSSTKHYIGDFFSFQFKRNYELLILFGVADYCSLSRSEFRIRLNKQLNEINPKYIIINFNADDCIVNELTGYEVWRKFISNSIVYVLTNKK